MNPIIANERNKKKCQKFTPLNKVDDMLDLAGYSRDLFGKKVLEYSFGSGNKIKFNFNRQLVVCVHRCTSVDSRY